MANNSKRNSNRAGAVLITVLTVACFAAILLTAVLTFVKRAHTNAFNNYNSEQAYYIASSALGSVHDYFEKQKDLNYPDLVAYANASPTGTEGTITLGDSAIDSVIPGGDCKVNISKVNDGYIKLSVTGYYNGQAETINAYYAVTPGQKSSGIDNALYSNGTAKFDKQCTNTGSVTTGGNYGTTNGSASSGTIICGNDFNVLTDYLWKNDPNGSASSYIIAGHNFNVDNGGFIAYPSFPKGEDNVSQFLSVGGLLNLALETRIGQLGYEFDAYCSTASISSRNKVIIYGNLYVYKLDDFEKIHNSTCGCDTTIDQNGDLLLSNEGELEIYGDVFVEGDINFTGDKGDSRNVHGTLYVSPTTEFMGIKPPLEQRKLTVDAISGEGLTVDKVKQWINDGYLRINGISGADDSNLPDKVLTNPIDHGSTTSRNYKPEVAFDPNYIKNYETTQEFLEKPANATIKGKYEHAMFTNLKDYKTSYHDADLDLDFQYYVDGKAANDGGNGCMFDAETVEGEDFSNGGKRVFVDMDQISGDYVIRVKCKSTEVYWPEHKFVSQMYMPTIVVKNGTRNEDGSWSSDKGEGCLYIILDSTAPNSEIIFMKTGIIDYYTYKYVVQKNYGINIGGYGNNGNGVNDINKTSGYTDPNGNDTGIYTPARTRIFLMLNPGDNMSTKNVNERNKGDLGLIEAVVYAPQASCNISTYGYSDLLFLKDTSSNQLSYLSFEKKTESDGSVTTVWKAKAGMAIMGAIICETFTGDENFGVGFVPPSTETNLGGGGGSEDVGTVTFSHYESR